MTEATPPRRARQRALSYPDDDDDDGSMPQRSSEPSASGALLSSACSACCCAADETERPVGGRTRLLGRRATRTVQPTLSLYGSKEAHVR